MLHLCVDGLRETGLGDPQNLRAFQAKELFEIRFRVALHDRIMRIVAKNLFATVLRNIFGDENEVKIAFAPSQRIAPHDDATRLHDEWEQSLDRFSSGCGIAHATFTLTL